MAKKSIWDTLESEASKVYDQANVFDNGLTYQQRTPTSNKSTGQQAGQVGGQTIRSLLGNTSKLINTGNLGAREVADTARMTVANLTNNPLAFKNANQAAQNDYNRFTTQGGVLNTGTVFQSPQEAQSGNLPTVARRVGGGTLGAAGELIPAARGATLMQTGGKVLPNVARGALEGAGYGAIGGVANQLTQSNNISISDVLKSAALGATLGGVTPVAAAAGKGIARAAENRTPLNEVGAVGKNVSDLGGARPNNDIQTAIEQAHNSGDNAKVAKLITQLPAEDQPAMRSALGIVSTKSPATVRTKSEFNPDQYIAEQTAAQQAARRGEGDIRQKLNTIASTTKARLIDTFSPIEDKVGQAVKQGAEINPKNNVTYAIDRALRSDQIAGSYIKDSGLAKIVQDVPDTKAFDQYLIAKRAQELDLRGVKTGRDIAKDTQLINALSGQYEPHAQALKAYQQDLLDKAVGYGLVSKEHAATLKRENPAYVPANRIFSEEEQQAINQGTGTGKASISTQSVVRKIKGSERQIESPLDSILQKTQAVIDQGERNQAARILTSYKDLPDNPLGLRELKSTEQVGSRPVVSFLDNGKVRRFETTPEVAAAAKGLNKEQLGLVGQILQYPTRALRLGATGLNAGFAAANAVKDIGTAIINTKHPVSLADPGVFLDALKAATNHRSAQYGELTREAAGGTSFDIARNKPVQNVARVRADKNVGTKALYTVTHPSEYVRAVENTIGRTEEFGRALQYFSNKKVFVKGGDTASNARLRAAHEARNNTVNFARAGDYGRVLNTALPYLNAGVQGSRILIRNLKDRPVQTGAKLAITAFLPVAAATAWAINDPERKKAWDNISEYEKQNNIIIVPPHPKQDASGRWNVIKIPLSQEVANLSNAVRNGVEAAKNDSSFNFAELAGNLAGAASSLQVQSPRQAVGQFIPQAIKPVAETLTNQNLYFGNQIVPDAIKNLEPSKQVNAGTSGTAKTIGNLTGTSPLQIDNAIRTATGGVGQQLVGVSDALLNKAGVIGKDEVKGQSIVGAITGRFDGAQGKTPGSMYFSTLQDEAKKQNIGGKDYQLLNALKAKEIDANGKPVAQNEQDALNAASIRANNPRVVDVEAAAAKKLAQTTGKKIDPIYNLSSAQRQQYYRIQSSPYKGDDYNRLTEDAKSWLLDFQKERSAFFDSLDPKDGVGVTPSARVKYPTFDDSTQSKLDSYFKITDPVERAKFIDSNPIVSKAFDQINKYTNARRVAQGYDPFKDFPTAAPGVEQALKAYVSLPAGADRSAWIKANPDAYAGVQKYMADTSAWQLANNAGDAKYQGSELNQKALKAAYGLGQFDIYKNPDTGVYTIDPQAAHQANFDARYGNRSGGGRSKGTAKTIGLSNGKFGGKKSSTPKVKIAKGAAKSSRIKVARAPRSSTKKVTLKMKKA